MLSTSLKKKVKPITLASDDEISIKPTKEEHKHKKQIETDHTLKKI